MANVVHAQSADGRRARCGNARARVVFKDVRKVTCARCMARIKEGLHSIGQQANVSTMPTKRQAPLAKPKRPSAASTVSNRQFTYSVILGQFCGCPEPQLRVIAHEGAHFRALRAELHRLAALVELHSIPTTETWVVGTKVGTDFEGCVYIELAHSGSKGRAEQERAIALLNEIATTAAEPMR